MGSVSQRNRPPFPNPPLALTVLEIRYPELAESISPRAQQQLRDALHDRLPLIETITEDQVEVALGRHMPASLQRRAFPRFFTRDRTTALVAKNEALVLETTAYAGWENFRLAIQDILEAFQDVSQPDGVLRLGLRYIDEIRVPGIESAPGDWCGYIDDHLLAAASREFIPPSLKPALWQGLVRYRTEEDSTLVVRYGPQQGYAVDPSGATRRHNPPAPGLFFLLDSDSFWQPDEVPEFRADTLLERCDRLHAPIREFFEIAVTDKLIEEVFDAKERPQ